MLDINNSQGRGPGVAAYRRRIARVVILIGAIAILAIVRQHSVMAEEMRWGFIVVAALFLVGCFLPRRSRLSHSVGIMDESGRFVSVPTASRQQADAMARELAGWRWSWRRGWNRSGNGTAVITRERPTR
jgi:hypothetical protein